MRHSLIANFLEISVGHFLLIIAVVQLFSGSCIAQQRFRSKPSQVFAITVGTGKENGHAFTNWLSENGVRSGQKASFETSIKMMAPVTGHLLLGGELALTLWNNPKRSDERLEIIAGWNQNVRNWRIIPLIGFGANAASIAFRGSAPNALAGYNLPKGQLFQNALDYKIGALIFRPFRRRMISPGIEIGCRFYSNPGRWRYQQPDYNTRYSPSGIPHVSALNPYVAIVIGFGVTLQKRN